MSAEQENPVKRVLVVGATGFIGARLCEILAQTPGYEVTALVRSPRRAEALARQGVLIRRADFAKDFTAALSGQDVVFNLAYDIRQGAEANLARFQNLVRCAQAARVGRLVHVSSIAVYEGWPGESDLTESAPNGAGVTPYQAAKVAMELELARLWTAGELASTILQPTIVYGPKSLLWTDLPVEKLRGGGLVLPEPEGEACNAVYVDDVVQGLILSSEQASALGERFILSGPHPVRWRDLFGGYARAIGRPEALLLKPASALATRTAPVGGATNLGPVKALLGAARAVVGEAGMARLRAIARRGRLQVSYPSPGDRALYQATGVCRIDKARDILGYAPAFDLERGLEATAAYLRRAP